ncbi:MAG TPA: periplasmic heavy metal sensor [Trinickia sp.]|uniref:periplasmic heavy metal sensor n=1 Tax=Trinickia sp. TaxID=2571163 RepID=UPI002C47D054|nr:periplasmic heavy metal sensor [Trinickia sp.]HTI16849.1 periplasmic heavy metal sensor [Trinickia sp.]
MFRTSSRFLVVAAAALAATFGTVYAAGESAPASAPGWHGAHHGHGPFGMRRLEALHAQLHLTPQQETKWQDAIAAMKQNREAMHANHEKMRQEFSAARQQSILDLDALHAAHQQFQEQESQLHEKTATTWLAFYDSLNDQQKTTVSTAIKQQFAKMEARREKMREHWEHHHHSGAASDAAPAQ